MAGGAVGCVIRWFFGVKLNSIFPSLPPGTLVVNLLGAFIIGAAVAYFLRHPHLDPSWKLLIVTGLCGGLTTGRELYVGIHIGTGSRGRFSPDDRCGFLPRHIIILMKVILRAANPIANQKKPSTPF